MTNNGRELEEFRDLGRALVPDLERFPQSRFDDEKEKKSLGGLSALDAYAITGINMQPRVDHKQKLGTPSLFYARHMTLPSCCNDCQVLLHYPANAHVGQGKITKMSTGQGESACVIAVTS